MSEFIPYQKIGRLKRTMVITEKIDGTNAQVHVLEDGTILAGSRNRYVTPEADNFGFAAWVKAHEDELRGLGPGRHFGEWWGSGIQRGYGLADGEKRFSLFNTSRWNVENPPPACCLTVPVLGVWTFDTRIIDETIAHLAQHGSVAAPGFMKPEGIVVFQAATGTLFKVTIEKDEQPKGAQ